MAYNNKTIHELPVRTPNASEDELIFWDTSANMAGKGTINAIVGDAISDDISDIETEIEQLREQIIGGFIIFNTKALMDADLDHEPNTFAEVINDPIPANNGVYRKVGDSGTGYWTQTLPGATSLTNRVTVANSDKIVICSCGNEKGTYCIYGKSYPQLLSAFSDYNFDVFSISGPNSNSFIYDVRTGTHPYHTSLSLRDYRPSYVFFEFYDFEFSQGTFEDIQYKLTSVCEMIRSIGATPVIMTSYISRLLSRGFGSFFKSLSEQCGALLIDKCTLGQQLGPSDTIGCPVYYDPFWNNGAPGIRTSHLHSGLVEPYINNLPRPKRSLKLFRLRSSVIVSSLDDLVFDTQVQRSRLFQEIGIGQASLDTGQEKYYDEIDTNPTHSASNSEYLNLMNGDEVALEDYTLIECVLPVAGKDIEGLGLYLSTTTDTSVYVLDTMEAPYETPSRRYGFTYLGTPNIQLDDTYKVYDDSDPPVEQFSGALFTVAANIASRKLIVSTEALDEYSSPTYLGPGYLSRVSGSGDSRIDFEEICVADTPDYYTYYGKPKGHWVEAPLGAEGLYEVSHPEGKIKGDKVAFLVHHTGGFNLTNVYVEYEGTEGKTEQAKTFEPVAANGTELLESTVFNDIRDLEKWVIYGPEPPITVPEDDVMPYGINGIVEVDTNTSIAQLLTNITPEIATSKPFQIKIWGRYFPEIFDSDAMTWPDDAVIKADSYDYAALKVEIIVIDPSMKVVSQIAMTTPVGLHWQEKTFISTLPADSQDMEMYVKLSSEDFPIQIAKVSVKTFDQQASTLVGDATTSYTTGSLDSEAEIIAAVNATNYKINKIFDILQEHNLMESA